MKTLSTKAAWVFLAGEFDRIANGGKSRFLGDNLGICSGLDLLLQRKRISNEQYGQMESAFQEAMASGYSILEGSDAHGAGYWWEFGLEFTHSPDGAAARAVACALMAELS